jgi:hypothetical protein
MGRTDTYNASVAPQRDKRKVALLQALSGIAPFDITGDMLPAQVAADSVARLNRYRKNWKFYLGEHWEQPYEDGELKPVMNFCQKVADTALSWFLGEGWTTHCVAGNEAVAEVLDACWEYSNKSLLTERTAQFGTITGDGFFYVTLETKKEDGSDLPANERKVRIYSLDPSYCFPVWNPLKPDQMLAILVQFPVSSSETGAEPELFSLYITPTEWRTWTNEKEVSKGVNPFSVVNVVHVPNLTLAKSSFGQGDFHQIVSLNEEYNLALNSMRKVIKYHAEPTTLIFGARAGDLDKGAKKVWSNLPVDGRVENLELQSDLGATSAYLDRLERLMRELSNTPIAALDPDNAKMSHTSGIAMQMMFQPLTEKNRRRQHNWNTALSKTNCLILKGMELLGNNVAVLAERPECLHLTEARFTSPLPKDEQALLDAAQKKVELGVWSNAEAVRQCAGVPDHRRLVVEIVADRAHDLANAQELARANNGEQPNLSSVMLDSLALSEDLTDLTKKIVAEEQKSASAA